MLDVEIFITKDSASEVSRLIQRSEKLLASALLSGTSQGVKAAVSFLKFKQPITYAQLHPIAEILWLIFEKLQGKIQEEIDVADSLKLVLRILNKLPDCPPIGSSDRLTLPWRHFYECLLRTQLHGSSQAEISYQPPTEVPIGSEARDAHAQAMFALVRRARNFFPFESANEIWAALRPYMCPHESTMYRNVGLLCLFMPEIVSDDFVAEALEIWSWIPNSHEWTYLWIHFFSRLMRHSPTFLRATQPYTSQIFEKFLLLLELPSSKESAQRPELRTWPADSAFVLNKVKEFKNQAVKKMTRLIVFSLAPESRTWDLLAQLLQYIAPFFHPLNEGAWTSALDMFLKMLTLNFTKRLGFESRKHLAKKPWSPSCPISSDEKLKFVQLLLPLAMSAFESKDYYMSFGAAQALKDLVSLQPDLVLPVVLDRLVPAIENSMKPHEALNSMEAFSVIMSSLLRSEGGLDSPVIGQMLQLTVAGIDNNDPMKTLKTLRLYMRLVTLVPLAHPSDVPGEKPEWVYILPDWSMEVIERLWNFLCNIPTLKKGSGLDYVLSKNVLRHFLDTFLMQMSPTMFSSALKLISRKLSSTYYPPAKKYFGQIIDAAVYANSAALSEFVPMLVSKVFDKSKSEIIGSGSEAAYWVHLLGHAVARGGSSLQPYGPSIHSIVDACMFHDEKGLSKEGNKLLRKTLKSFLLIRPVDVRSLPPTKWKFESCASFGSLVNPDISPSDSDVQFIVPDENCLQHAREIVERHVQTIKSKVCVTGINPAILRKCLRCLEAVIRGAAALFPERGADFEAISTESSELDIDEREGSVDLARSFKISSSEWSSKTRKDVSLLIQQLCSLHGDRENPDVVTAKSLVRVLHRFLSSSGYKVLEKESINYNKAVYRLYGNGLSGTFTRNMIVQKTHSLLTRRLDCGAWALNSDTEKLLDSLLTLCMHEYSLVRKKAQKVLPFVISRYPRFGDKVIEASLRVFSTANSSKAAVNGAIFTINTQSMLKSVSRSWNHTSALISGLIASHHFQDLKVHVRLSELWNAFVPYSSRRGFACAVHHTNLDKVKMYVNRHYSDVQMDDILVRGRTSAEGLRKFQEDKYDSAVASIVNAISESGVLHWRFTLLAACAMYLMLRKEKPPQQAVLEFFVKGLTSDVLPLRQVCRMALPTIDFCVKAGSSMEISPEKESMETDQAIQTLADLDLPLAASFDGPYVDCLWRGWTDDSDVLSSSCSDTPKPSSAKASWLGDAFPVDRFCDLLASDHRLSGDERAQEADKPVAGMQLPSNAVLNLFDSSWPWPKTSAAPFSSAFNRRNVFLVECLVGMNGEDLVNRLWPKLKESMAQYSDREQQCLAAELLAGLARASFDSDANLRKSIVVKLEDLIRSSLASISTESSGDWMESIRMIVVNRDPRRCLWLARGLLPLIPTAEAATSVATNGLKLLQALMIESSWKGYTLAYQSKGQAYSLLAGASKSVREEAAKCLVLMSQVDAALGCKGVTSAKFRQSSPSPRELLTANLEKVCERLSESYSCDPNRAAGSPAMKLVQQEIEGVLFYFIHAARLGNQSSVDSRIASVLPLMLMVQEDGDREFAQTASRTLAGSASWRVRLGALEVARVVAHRGILTSATRCHAMTIFKNALGDKVVDVRSFAHLCLAGLLRMASSADISSLLAEAPKPRRRGAARQADSPDALAARHGKVLGVSAAILSHPTDLPDWMADAVCALCSLQDEDPVIKQSIVHVVGEFKKTHQDMWALISMTWTPDQLSLLSDVAGARSYYS